MFEATTLFCRKVETEKCTCHPIQTTSFQYYFWSSEYSFPFPFLSCCFGFFREQLRIQKSFRNDSSSSSSTFPPPFPTIVAAVAGFGITKMPTKNTFTSIELEKIATLYYLPNLIQTSYLLLFCTQKVLGKPPHDSFICTTTTTAVGTVSAAAEKKRREWENKLLLAGLLVSAIFSPPHFRRRQFGKRRVARYYAAGGGGGLDTAQPDECYFLSCTNPSATKSGGWSKRGGGEESLAVVSSRIRNNK